MKLQTITTKNLGLKFLAVGFFAILFVVLPSIVNADATWNTFVATTSLSKGTITINNNFAFKK